MVRLRIISILLLLLFIGIPAAAEDKAVVGVPNYFDLNAVDELDLKPAVVSPNPFEIKPKILWDANDWLHEGNRLSANLDSFIPSQLGAFNAQEQALMAYNEGLKKAGNDKSVTADLYEAKALSYSAVGANGLAIDAFTKAVENLGDGDSDKKKRLLTKKAYVLDVVGRHDEATAIRSEIAKTSDNKRQDLPLPIEVILCSLLVAFAAFSRKTLK